MNILSNEVSVGGGKTAISILFELEGTVFHQAKIFEGGVLEATLSEPLLAKSVSAEMAVPAVEEPFVPAVEPVFIPEVPSQEVQAETSVKKEVYSEKDKPSFKRWTPEEEIEVFKVYFDKKSIEDVVQSSSQGRGYNAIHARLIKIKEYFLSNDPKQYGHLESAVLGSGVGIETLKSFVAGIDLKPFKNYKK